MAATVIVIRDKEEYSRIVDLLGQLEEGGIIVSPSGCESLDVSNTGWEQVLSDEGNYIDYDYGGQCEVMIDVARGSDYATDELIGSIEGCKAD